MEDEYAICKRTRARDVYAQEEKDEEYIGVQFAGNLAQEDYAVKPKALEISIVSNDCLPYLIKFEFVEPEKST